MNFLGHLSHDEGDDTLPRPAQPPPNANTQNPPPRPGRREGNDRPRSIMSPGGRHPAAQVRRTLETDDEDDGALARNINPTNDTYEDDNDQDNDYDSQEDDDDEDDVQVLGIRNTRKPPNQEPTSSHRPPTHQQNAPPAFPTQGAARPIPPPASALTHAAQLLMDDSPPTALVSDLEWQRQVTGDATATKAFRGEVLQRSDLLVFAYMRPSSPFIHLLHTVGTFSLPGGDDHYKGKDIAFVGDRADSRVPTPVVLAPMQPWTWITKKNPYGYRPPRAILRHTN